MAWWTHILLFREDSEDNTKYAPARNDSLLAVFRRVLPPKILVGGHIFPLKILSGGRTLQNYFYDHLVDFLFVSLSIFAYLYLLLTIVTFFFEDQAPKYLPDIIETLAEPYLGAIGIYIVVKEIERRRGKNLRGIRKSDFFTLIWFIFFVAASFFTYFSEHYHWSALYKTIVTNALAAIIIRIGAFIK
jgi:hypothetical protein